VTERIARDYLNKTIVIQNALAVLETASPPTYYIHRSDIEMDLLEQIREKPFCEWKGKSYLLGIKGE
jgi:uncharacterized protein (DUF427 family)